MPLEPGQKLSHYRIVEKIGEGGMGVVWKARDEKLRRDVALKVLPAELVEDPERRRRLLREARSAAAINHPNIGTVHEVDEADGTVFIAMELVEGETLRSLLGGKPLAIPEALRIATEMAEGLVAAHQAGVIHRDLKPENVLVRPDGHVKILDFGLAKVHEEARPSGSPLSQAETVTDRMTRDGVVMGTPAYMSPEQVRGEAVDARSDLFCFGSMLYEMVTGKMPFEGRTHADTLAAILNQPAAPPSGINADVPAELERILGKCLEKDPKERYQHTADLAVDLRQLRGTTKILAPVKTVVPRPPRLVLALAAALALAVVIFGYLQFGPRRDAGTAGAVTPERKRILVLPFENVGDNLEVEYLSDGITESLISSLATLPALRVISRNSSFRYKGREADLQEIGRALGIEIVITGRVQHRGENLQIGVELVELPGDVQLWGKQYSRRMTDIFQMQEEIARAITEALHIRLTGEESIRLAKHSTDDHEAYRLYLKGRYHWNQRTEQGIRKAIEYFQQAIGLDPTYAFGYSGLADCYIVLPGYSDTLRADAGLKAEAAAQRAIQLDDSLAQPHAALGNLYGWQYRWEDAEREFQRAIELDPNYATLHQWYGLHLVMIGRFDEAIAEAETALRLDPLSFVINWTLGDVYYLSGQIDRSIEQDLKTVDMDPSYPFIHDDLGQAYYQAGRYDEWAHEWVRFAELSGDLEGAAVLRRAYEDSGVEGVLRQIVETENPRPRETATLAWAHGQLGDHDRAFELLQDAIEFKTELFLFGPRFDSMRSDPRFQDLLRQMNFPE